MFHSSVAESGQQGARVPGRHLLLVCGAWSVLLHAALLMLLPDYRMPRSAQTRPLTVGFTTKAPPLPVVEPPEEKKPQARSEPHAQRLVFKRTKIVPAPAPVPRPTVTDSGAPVIVVPLPTVPSELEPAPAATIGLVPRADSPRAPESFATAKARVTPTYLYNPAPSYPMVARRRGDEGTVMVKVLVTAEGLPASVAVEKTSGHSALDESALDAVKAWRFVPAREGRRAMEAFYIVPVVYKLN
jgi:periplasmic protein TonB